MKPWKGKPAVPLKRRLEKNELSKLYKRAKQAHRDGWYTNDIYGEKITALRDRLNLFGPDDANQMWNAFLDATWLATAPADLRYLAVALAAETQSRIRREAGLIELSDPLPPDDNVYLRIRELLR